MVIAKKASIKNKKDKPPITLIRSDKGKFIGEFVEFKTKHNSYEDYFGLVLKNIRTLPYKKLVCDSQWFYLTKSFMQAFKKYKDEELPGKKLKFEGIKETHKKGYYAYRDNVLVEHPDDLEYKVVRATKIQVQGK